MFKTSLIAVLAKRKVFTALVTGLVLILFSSGAIAVAGIANPGMNPINMVRKYFVDGFRFDTFNAQDVPEVEQGGDDLELLVAQALAAGGGGFAADEAALDLDPVQAYRGDETSASDLGPLQEQIPEQADLDVQTMPLLGTDMTLDEAFSIMNTPAQSRLGQDPATENQDITSPEEVEQAEVVPLPGAVWALGAGLIGLYGLRKKFV